MGSAAPAPDAGPRAVLARVLALPREAGTPEAAEARGLIAEWLAARGYTVTTQRFSFNPSTLDAFPLFGTGLGGLALLVLPLLLLAGVPRWAAAAAWFAALAALAIFAAGVGLGWAGFGSKAREDANLVAVRDASPVTRWIVAHADTKAQGHSMAGRIVAVWTVLAAIAIMTALALLRLGGPLGAAVAAAGVALTVVAGALAARGRLRGRSPGARDNGSGLHAALAAAEVAGEGTGILITGAEEFGLIGARIFAQLAGGELRGTEVVNIDTVDDRGDLYLVSHDGRGAELARRELPALAKLGPRVRTRALPLGIFVDSHPLARAGAAAITIGRLDWSTLRRLHTAADTPDGLDFDLAIRIGRAVARSN